MGNWFTKNYVRVDVAGDGSTHYYNRHGQHHRIDGPAVEGGKIKNAYRINGKVLSYSEFVKKARQISEVNHNITSGNCKHSKMGFNTNQPDKRTSTILFPLVLGEYGTIKLCRKSNAKLKIINNVST